MKGMQIIYIRICTCIYSQRKKHSSQLLMKNSEQNREDDKIITFSSSVQYIWMGCNSSRYAYEMQLLHLRIRPRAREEDNSIQCWAAYNIRRLCIVHNECSVSSEEYVCTYNSISVFIRHFVWFLKSARAPHICTDCFRSQNELH